MTLDSLRLSPTPRQVEETVRTLVGEGSGVPLKFVFSPNRPIKIPLDQINATVMPLEEISYGVPWNGHRREALSGKLKPYTGSIIISHYSVEWRYRSSDSNDVADTSELERIQLITNEVKSAKPDQTYSHPPGWSSAHIMAESAGRFHLWAASEEGLERAAELGVNICGSSKVNTEHLTVADGEERLIYRLAVSFTRELYPGVSVDPIEGVDIGVHDPSYRSSVSPIDPLSLELWEASPSTPYSHPIRVRGSDGLQYNSIAKGDLTVNPVASEWVSGTSYSHPVVVRGSNSKLYRSTPLPSSSMINPRLNDPVRSAHLMVDGGWMLVEAVNWEIVPEEWIEDKMPSYPSYAIVTDSRGLKYEAVDGGNYNKYPNPFNEDNWKLLYNVTII